jgi:hypothetical protein
MTLDEAIKELTKQLSPKYSTPHTPFHNAIKLGIEALKRLKEHRETFPTPHVWRLPGETEK